MIYKIIGSVMFSFLIIALMLSFLGVQEIYLGDGCKLWLSSVQKTFESWSFNIPKIPQIPYLSQSNEIKRNVSRVVTTPVIDNSSGIGAGIKNIVNVLIFIANFFVTLINVLITILNVVISIIRFVLTIIYCVKDLPYYLRNYQWTRWSGDNSIWWWRNVA